MNRWLDCRCMAAMCKSKADKTSGKPSRAAKHQKRRFILLHFLEAVVQIQPEGTKSKPKHARATQEAMAVRRDIGDRREREAAKGVDKEQSPLGEAEQIRRWGSLWVLGVLRRRSPWSRARPLGVAFPGPHAFIVSRVGCGGAGGAVAWARSRFDRNIFEGLPTAPRGRGRGVG